MEQITLITPRRAITEVLGFAKSRNLERDAFLTFFARWLFCDEVTH